MRGLARQGGVKINGTVQPDPLAMLSAAAGITLQVGKRKIVKLV